MDLSERHSFAWKQVTGGGQGLQLSTAEGWGVRWGLIAELCFAHPLTPTPKLELTQDIGQKHYSSGVNWVGQKLLITHM